MKLMKRLKMAAAAVALLTAGAANATVYQFDVSGDYTARWQFDTDTLFSEPQDYITNLYFTYWDIVGTFPGASEGVADVSFFNAGFGGGLSFYDYFTDRYLLITNGPQIFTGSEDAPSFQAGTFAMTEDQGTGTYTLNVTELGAPADVPEPATGALLLGGLGLLIASRKRRQG